MTTVLVSQCGDYRWRDVDLFLLVLLLIYISEHGSFIVEKHNLILRKLESENKHIKRLRQFNLRQFDAKR